MSDSILGLERGDSTPSSTSSQLGDYNLNTLGRVQLFSS